MMSFHKVVTKLQPPHGESEAGKVKCSATVVRIVLHPAKNNKKAPVVPPSRERFPSSKKVFYHD
jgi:hypothetical protein